MRLLRSPSTCLIALCLPHLAAAQLSTSGTTVQTAEVASLVPRVVGGAPTTTYETVGMILSDRGVCTGTLIGCRTVLTAAHCVCPTEEGGLACQPGEVAAPDPARILFYLQHAGLSRVSEVIVPPDFGQNDFTQNRADVALLRLAAPVRGIRPARLNGAGTPASGTPATIVGFGDSGRDAADGGIKRAGGVTVGACVDQAGADQKLCWEYDGSDATLCRGDSGGPLFVDYGAGPLVAGVASEGFGSVCEVGSLAVETDVHTFLPWIRARGGSDVGATCGVERKIGEPGAVSSGVEGMLAAGSPDARGTFEVPPGAEQLRLGLNGQLSDEPPDLDLYVRRGAPPSLLEFDCASRGAPPFEFCRVPRPEPGTWHTWVRRRDGEGAYQLVASVLPRIVQLLARGEVAAVHDPAGLLQGVLAPGDPFAFSFLIRDGLPDLDPALGSAVFVDAGGRVAAELGGLSVSCTTAALRIGVDLPGDEYAVEALAGENGALCLAQDLSVGIRAVGLSLVDSGGAALAAAVLRLEPPELGVFDRAEAVVAGCPAQLPFCDPASEGFRVVASLQSLPEPAAAAWAALAALALLRRSGRTE